MCELDVSRVLSLGLNGGAVITATRKLAECIQTPSVGQSNVLVLLLIK